MTSISRRSLLIAGAATGLTATLTRPAEAVSGRATTFTHVTVIDPASARVIPDTTVIIRGDRITAVGGQVPADTRIVDLRGKYLIPGLADMHTHAQAEGIDTGLCIANGVTTVRDMAGSPLAHDWRTRIEAGTLLGPRYTIGSRIIDGLPSVWNQERQQILREVAMTAANTPATTTTTACPCHTP